MRRIIDMADAGHFKSRDRRGARMFLALTGPWASRLCLSLIIACAFGRLFAAMTQGIERFPQPPILEYDPGTAYLSRYLGQPDEEEMMEADPADAPSYPNNDRFYRNIAARVKGMISNPKDKCGAVVRGMGACDGARGWPFTSRDVSYLVDAYELSRVDGKPTQWYVFRADEFGLDPERPRGWWGNAAFGGILSGVIAYIILTLVAMGLQRSMRPVAGFPVIVPDQPR